MSPENDNDCCHLCAQLAGERSGDLLQELLGTREYVRRVVLESAEFAVIPSLGALVEGHVLVLPKAHVRSFAQLGTSAGETESFLERARLAVESAYSPPQIFEHGTGARSPQPACSVEHAHIHLVPCEVDLFARLADRFSWSRVGGEAELAELVGDGEYLRIGVEGGWMVARGGEGFPSQLLRRELLGALAGPERDWNWRTSPRPELVASTFRALRGRD
jgi:ATP adenylyltransferase